MGLTKGSLLQSSTWKILSHASLFPYYNHINSLRATDPKTGGVLFCYFGKWREGISCPILSAVSCFTAPSVDSLPHLLFQLHYRHAAHCVSGPLFDWVSALDVVHLHTWKAQKELAAVIFQGNWLQTCRVIEGCSIKSAFIFCLKQNIYDLRGKKRQLSNFFPPAYSFLA